MEGNDLAKQQIFYMVGTGLGCLIAGAVIGAFVVAPWMEKAKAKKAEKAGKAAPKGATK